MRARASVCVYVRDWAAAPGTDVRGSVGEGDRDKPCSCGCDVLASEWGEWVGDATGPDPRGCDTHVWKRLWGTRPGCDLVTLLCELPACGLCDGDRAQRSLRGSEL